MGCGRLQLGKIVIIDTCDECKHFDNEYWDYNRTCGRLKRIIEKAKDEKVYTYPIPPDCPLPNASELK